MYTIRYSSQFKASVHRCKLAGKNLQELWDAVALLIDSGCLPESYLPHQLHGVFAGLWECHIEDDWLLIWRQDDHNLTLVLTDTGTHKSLFG
ncbi:MAG: type II toxin-antitoxin system YafQ family toxin [Bacteroidales bacterium]|nr:type II toxin-antitoxin system YafQ family toxin [Bacteroidales bacterium]